jgi:caa(3)-type oxidase subunit IV
MKTLEILLIGAGLLVLATVSLLLSRLDLAAAAVPVALTIALVKASGIAWWYMHLKEQRGGSRIAILTAGSLILVLISIVLLEAADRKPPANAPGPFVVLP